MQAEQTQRLQDDYTTKRKNLLINMTKLQSGTLVGLQNEATDLDTARNVDNVSRLSVKVGHVDGVWAPVEFFVGVLQPQKSPPR